jgi:hypothetical protein
VRVFVKHRPVGADMARGVPLLGADGSDAARRQPGRARANQLGGAADQLELGEAWADVQLGLEEIERLGEVLKGVPTND